MNKNFDNNICRTCVTKQDQLHCLFSEFNKSSTNLAEMLAGISIQVAPDDNLPKYICEACSKTLLVAYKFKQQCEESYKRLNECLKTSSKADIIDYNFQDSFLSSMILVEIETITDSDIEATTSLKEHVIPTSTKAHSQSSENNNFNKTEMSSYIEEKVLKLYTCKLCKRNFRSRYGLNYHVKRHQGTKSYMCPFENCKKQFTNGQSLKKHKSIHFNERKHLCNICGKTFNLMDSLNYHLKTHGGVRLHLCAYCGRSFKQACHLKVHMWRHTGIKPYLCSSCGRKYTTGDQLKKHNRKYCGIGKIPPKPRRRRDMSLTSAEDLTNHVNFKDELY